MPSPIKTPTPKTDAEYARLKAIGHNWSSEDVNAMCDFARQLETELAEAHGDIETFAKNYEWAKAEVADHERWFKEMMADYRLQADDHKASWRYAINCKIHDLRSSLAASQERVRELEAKIHHAEMRFEMITGWGLEGDSDRLNVANMKSVAEEARRDLADVRLSARALLKS